MHRCFSWSRRQTDRIIQFDLEKMWKRLTDRVGGHKFSLNELISQINKDFQYKNRPVAWVIPRFPSIAMTQLFT